MVGETELPALAEAADSGHRLVSGIQPVSCRGWCAAGTRGGRDFVSFLFIVAVIYLIARRVQRKRSARTFTADSPQPAPVVARTPAAAQNPAGTHDPVPNAPAMPAYSPTQMHAAAGYPVDYYHRRLNRPYGKIVLIWAAVGAAVAFMFAFFGDAGGS